MSQPQPTSQPQQAQGQSHPILINLPPQSPTPETPDMPGTPTSTTTSLSALSTTAIKDGHRGHLPAHNKPPHTPHTLEAERAERISRLAGLERVSMRSGNAPSSPSSHPYQYQYQPGGNTPAYFDAQGQPTTVTKMSTVGTASATGSYSGRSDDGTTAVEDEDVLSLGTRDFGSVASHGDFMSHGGTSHEGDGSDGEASLVGFGEGAGSTISGPIYRRHGERAEGGAGGAAAGERGSDTPVSVGALQERRAARGTNGVVVDEGQEGFVDTTTREPVPVSPRKEWR